MAVDIRRLAAFISIQLLVASGAASIELRSGDSLKLTCSGALDWWTLIRDSRPIIVVTYKPSKNAYDCVGLFLPAKGSSNCRPEITINNATGENIVFSTVDYGDAGTYTCQSNPIQTTEVVVVQNDGPTLQFNLTSANSTALPTGNNEVYQGEKLWFNCTIRYGGLISPTMELVLRSYTGTERVLNTIASRNVSFSQNQRITIATDYNVSSSDRNFAVFCRLPFFGATSMTKTATFDAIYGPILRDNQNITVILDSNSATLSCIADSYPRATYAWFRLDNGRPNPVNETGNTTRVSEVGGYRCMASNPLTNATVLKDFIVQGASTTASTSNITSSSRSPSARSTAGTLPSTSTALVILLMMAMTIPLI